MKKLRVLALMHEEDIPPEDLEGMSDQDITRCKTEYDVMTALQALGHEALPVGVVDDLNVVRNAIREAKPHIVFNLLEEFSGLGTYVPFILGYFELINQRYTGCNPRGLMLTDNKALMRKVLRHHRILMPDFVAFRRGKIPRRPKRLEFPLIVKSPTQHGSVGIAHASVVHNDEKLRERVQYVYEQMSSDVIIEQYIEGRELYMAVMGHLRLQTFPVWELRFDNLPDGAPRIATEKVKWDVSYQTRAGIQSRKAKDLPEGTEQRVTRICKRVYRILGLSGYARMDFRLTEDGKLYLLEPNPNPDIALDEEFSESARASGTDYDALIARILNLGMRYRPELM